MIFLTIGTDRGFDRLVLALDNWAAEKSQIEIFGQIGRSKCEPSNFAFARFLSSTEFKEKIDQCSIIVSHAGMGNVLTALSVGKPIIVFPRRKEFGELGNSHQLDTVEALKGKGLAQVAFNEAELRAILNNSEKSFPQPTISKIANKRFCDNLIKKIDATYTRNANAI